MSESSTGPTDETDGSAGERAQDAGSILPGFIARSFLAKFVVSLLLVLVVVGGVSFYTINQTSAQITEDIETEYTGVAQQNAEQIDQWLDSRADTTRRLSEFGVMQSGNTDAIGQFLRDEKTRLPADVFRLHYVNLDTSTIVASSNEANVGATLNSRESPWLADLANVTYGSNGVFTSAAKEAHQQSEVDFVSEVDAPGSANMVLVMQVNFDSFARNLTIAGSGTFSQIVDGEGRTVAGTRTQDLLERNDGFLTLFPGGADAEVIQNALRGESGFLSEPVTYAEAESESQRLDESHVRAFAPVEGANWAVVTHVSESTAFSLRSTIQNSLLILVATVFLGLGFIGFVFGRGAVRALNRLTEKARALASGDLDVDLPVERADEFGTLTATFATMRDSLRERINEAEQARKEAEQARVQAVEMNTYLQETAATYSEIMEQCASGDLTQRMAVDGENEAMDQIASDFNEMIGELEKTTGQLQTFSDEVIESSDFVLTSAESVREASEQVAESAQKISDDAHEQRDRLQQVANNLDEVVTTFEQMATDNPELDIEAQLDQLREFQQQLETAVETSDGLLPETENVAGAAEEQAAELNEVSSRADRLKRYAQPLGDIVNKFETDDEHEFVFSTGPSESPTDD